MLTNKTYKLYIILQESSVDRTFILCFHNCIIYLFIYLLRTFASATHNNSNYNKTIMIYIGSQISQLVVVVYLMMNQRQMGYLTSSNEQPVGRYNIPLRFKKADATVCSRQASHDIPKQTY